MGVYVRIKRAYLWHGYRKGAGKERNNNPRPVSKQTPTDESREKETRIFGKWNILQARIPFHGLLARVAISTQGSV